MHRVKKILPILGFISLIFLLPTLAAANDDAFTIPNIEISHSGDETAISKIKAIETGEMEALRSVLSNLGAAGRVQNLSSEQVGLLVESYELQNEKTTETSYSATMTVSFNPAQVKALLGNGQNAPPGKPEVLVGQPMISLRAVFRDIPEWLIIKDKLQKMNFVQKTEIKDIAAQSADMDIYYQGAVISDLPQLFQSYGMHISGGPSGWILQDAGEIPQPTPQTLPQTPPQAASQITPQMIPLAPRLLPQTVPQTAAPQSPPPAPYAIQSAPVAPGR